MWYHKKCFWAHCISTFYLEAVVHSASVFCRKAENIFIGVCTRDGIFSGLNGHKTKMKKCIHEMHLCNRNDMIVRDANIASYNSLELALFLSRVEELVFGGEIIPSYGT